MKKSKGFTLVELVIVIVIVAVLAIVAVPIYAGYVRKSISSEGEALMSAILTAQKIYYAQNSTFFTGNVNNGYDSTLDVDARQNKYFQTFEITKADASSFTASSTAVMSTEKKGQGNGQGNTKVTDGMVITLTASTTTGAIIDVKNISN
ncbi:MAG: prepilin-type N-terminal cleavage/methylation domain-containing protein [Endomicrobia bacterium]|nr:prepilin-type N-terminal cleavage/methylation domain-containing protein [Endomicrobiia bacterium]